MSNELSALLARVEGTDPGTAKELRRHVDALLGRRQFGLNFERHTPESIALTGRPVSVGDKVRVLPARGETKIESDATWTVTNITGPKENRVAILFDSKTEEEAARALDNLVYVADFRDPIYPGLKRSDEPVLRGGDKPFHTVINAENYHALEALMFTHQGTVDCIYIDPPYNNREKTWKYNNDYVDPGDSYAHSKWLAFMERRLRAAKRLLNPSDSVLIVTIDENEVNRLALLLEQTFRGMKIQMVTTVIKPGGTSRTKEFSRVEEYLFFVFVGAAELVRAEDNMLAAQDDEELDDSPKTLTESDLWEGMIRRGIGVVRTQREKQFYPIFTDIEKGRIVEWGMPLGKGVHRNTVADRPGLVTVWPIKDDLTEGFWQLGPDGLARARQRGTVRVGSFNKKTGQWRIQYMKAKKAKAVDDGTVATLGKDENGVVILDLDNSSLSGLSTPRTVWNKTSHDASTGGAVLLNKILPGRKFDYAKSLYAVEDAIRFFTADKPEALILDFFAGSGTTAHAVMRLNKQDAGRRRCVSVTNNEVNDQEDTLRHQQLRPGDPDWEAHGICERFTKPRIKAAVTGETPDGKPIEGDYKYTDSFPISDGFEENVEFFTLTYENPALVELDLAFERIAPLLWMRAGSEGRRIDVRNGTFDVADTYAVLFNVDSSNPFLAAVEKADELRVAYVVTDDEVQYQAIAGQLPDCVESVRLYESYLRTFQINTGRA